MSDSFRETTSVSWFGRIGRSFLGMLVGLALIVGMVALLFWNEGRAVTTARSLAEGANAVVAISSDAVDAANDGKLVHVGGQLTTASTPEDTDFGISIQGVRLVRNVEMYQWIEESQSETTKKLGGGEETVTTYSYSRAWKDKAIDASSFKRPDGHGNPSMEVSGQSFQIQKGTLGAFSLDRPVLNQIGGEQALTITPAMAADIQAAYPGSEKVSVFNGGIYLGASPASPAIGDYRISYQFVPLGDISVIAQQSGASFAPYQTAAGDALLMVQSGMVPADRMFADAVSENNVLTWIVRVVGLLFLAIGFGLVMGPVGVLADIIPFLGSIVRLGTGTLAVVLAVLVGTSTIALAWFYYRPLLAIGIIVAGALVAYAITYLGRSRKPVTTVAA